MDQQPAEIVADARQMLQIKRLAVTPVEAHENPQYLRMPLRAHDGIGHVEGRPVKTAGRGAGSDIGVDNSMFERRLDGDARIERERCDVVCRRADQRILEIDDAKSIEAGKVSTPDEIR